MASDNVFDVAKKLKLWDGKEPFCFWKAYSGANYLKEVKNYSIRELYILQQLAPSLNLTDSISPSCDGVDSWRLLCEPQLCLF